LITPAQVEPHPFRILNKEYERTIASSHADILHAMTCLMLRRLTVPAEDRKERR
jgi:hypothetical protein